MSKKSSSFVSSNSKSGGMGMGYMTMGSAYPDSKPAPPPPSPASSSSNSKPSPSSNNNNNYPASLSYASASNIGGVPATSTAPPTFPSKGAFSVPQESMTVNSSKKSLYSNRSPPKSVSSSAPSPSSSLNNSSSLDNSSSSLPQKPSTADSSAKKYRNETELHSYNSNSNSKHASISTSKVPSSASTATVTKTVSKRKSSADAKPKSSSSLKVASSSSSSSSAKPSKSKKAPSHDSDYDDEDSSFLKSAVTVDSRMGKHLDSTSSSNLSDDHHAAAKKKSVGLKKNKSSSSSSSAPPLFPATEERKSISSTPALSSSKTMEESQEKARREQVRLAELQRRQEEEQERSNKDRERDKMLAKEQHLRSQAEKLSENKLARLREVEDERDALKSKLSEKEKEERESGRRSSATGSRRRGEELDPNQKAQLELKKKKEELRSDFVEKQKQRAEVENFNGELEEFDGELNAEIERVGQKVEKMSSERKRQQQQQQAPPKASKTRSKQKEEAEESDEHDLNVFSSKPSSGGGRFSFTKESSNDDDIVAEAEIPRQEFKEIDEEDEENDEERENAFDAEEDDDDDDSDLWTGFNRGKAPINAPLPNEEKKKKKKKVSNNNNEPELSAPWAQASRPSASILDKARKMKWLKELQETHAAASSGSSVEVPASTLEILADNDIDAESFLMLDNDMLTQMSIPLGTRLKLIKLIDLEKHAQLDKKLASEKPQLDAASQKLMDELLRRFQRNLVFNPQDVEIFFDSQLGRGGFASVCLAKVQGRHVAAKLFDAIEDGVAEAERMQNLFSKYIVQLIGVSVVPSRSREAASSNMAITLASKPRMVMLMELAEGSLADLMASYDNRPANEWLSWDTVARYSLQIAAGLAFLHSRKPNACLHLDLKPGNVLLAADGMIVKLADLGISRETHKTSMTATSIHATPLFAPPEQLMSDKKLSTRNDVYSFGATLFVMTCKKQPYDGSLREFMAKNSNNFNSQDVSNSPTGSNSSSNNYGITPLVNTYQPLETCPAFLANLVRKCLQVDPEKRPVSGVELLQELAQGMKESMPHLVVGSGVSPTSASGGSGGSSAGGFSDNSSKTGDSVESGETRRVISDAMSQLIDFDISF